MGYNLRWYTDEGHLRSLGRGHLNQLLARYEKELAEEGITIAQPEKDADFYRELATVFMRPEGIPPALHEALFHIEGLDTKGGFERIVDAVMSGKLKIDLKEESSPADKVLQAWIQNERLVRQLFIEAGLDASKSFVHFRARGMIVPAMRDFGGVKAQLEECLSRTFLARGRGEGCEVIPHPRGKEMIFVVYHGEPFRRETRRNGKALEPIFYWPNGQDLVVYNSQYRTLRMNVQARWQKMAYAQEFGELVFGNRSLFQEEPLYTLEPLRQKGRQVLEGRAFGIGSIALVELHTTVDENTNDVRIRRADDVFTAYHKEVWLNGESDEPPENDGSLLPEGEPLALAKFSLQFEGSKRKRLVSIEVPNRAKYTQDKDGVRVTDWLRESGISLAAPVVGVDNE